MPSSYLTSRDRQWQGRRCKGCSGQCSPSSPLPEELPARAVIDAARCGPSLSRQLPHAQPLCGKLFVVAVNEQIVFHCTTAPRRYGQAAFISLIAPTGKELSRRAGHSTVSLGFLVLAAFKPSMSLHLRVALIKHRSGGNGVREAATGVCAGTWMWDVGNQ